jgi:VCBS repeat protein/ASPIC/UnbV protein
MSREGLSSPRWALLVSFASAALALGACVLAEDPKPSRPPGTLRMIGLLEEVARNVDPAEAPFLNRERAALYRSLLRPGLAPQEEVDLRLQLAIEVLRSGESAKAIEEAASIEPLLERVPAEGRSVYRWLFHQFLAMSNIRLAEDENCVAHHTSDSCIIPVRGSGVHAQPRGSRAAIQHLTACLKEKPDDLGAVWLLNLASMTLGEYPSKVPSRWLVPEQVFASGHDVKRFRDVAVQCGLAVRGLAGGAIMEDFDRDGLLDVMCSSWGLRDQLRFFRNDGNGGFTERTEEAGLMGLTGGLNLIHADYDNDGFPDVFVLRGAWFHSQGRHPNSLIRNHGDGTFEDVTEAAGVLSFHPTQTAAWADYDGDGWLDLYIGNESDDENRHSCELFHNEGDGSFTECAAALGVANVGFVKGVAWGDYDNDGRPDLYLSRLDEPNILYRNGGPRRKEDAPVPGKASPVRPWIFEDVTARAGVTGPLRSFPTWFWDYDNDGWLDLLVLGYGWGAWSAVDVAADYLGLPSRGEKPCLYRNRGDGTFEDVTKAARVDKVLISMGSNFGDLDNDGWLDFYVGTGEPDLSALMPNRMFRSFEGKFFQDVTTSGGFGHLQKGHGIAFGDVDNDGDQDIYAVFGGAYQGDGFQRALFENPGHGSHWVTLSLQGTRSNRCAIGARIEVRVPRAGRIRSIRAVVSTGGSFGSSSLQQEIGLDEATSIQSVRVTWPATGETQVFDRVPVDSFVKIQEGEATFEASPGGGST